MFSNEEIKKYLIGTDIQASILESGNLREIRKGIVRLNTFVGNNLEPTLSNIYLRIEENGEYFYTRLLGIGSPSSILIDSNKVIYQGTYRNVSYSVIFTIIESVFFYKVSLLKNSSFHGQVTIYYGMDVSINNIYAINSNEAYVSQYIDHKAYETKNGYVICSRQNQGEHYYLEQGSLSKNIAYSVDGFQFFGKTYKTTNIPAALQESILPSNIYQYELAYCALQSKPLDLSINQEMVFYGCFKESHNESITKPLYIDYVEELYNQKGIELFLENAHVQNISLKSNLSFNNVLKSLDMLDEDIKMFYPKMYQCEYYEDELYSFFSDNLSHVVLPKKEDLLERPSGNILFSVPLDKNTDFDFENVLASSCYIYGLFNSQIVFGNTSFNKLLSNQRTPLNIQKISGQRIFIKVKGIYYLLGMPSLYEMGLNYCKWYYKLENDLIIITTTMATHESKVMLSFKSMNNIHYEIILTNQLTMGQTEYENNVHASIVNQVINLNFDENSMAYKKYPKRHFTISLDKYYLISDDQIFYQDSKSRHENLLTLQMNEAEFKLLICGIDEKNVNNEFLDEEKEKKSFIKLLKKYMNNFHIELGNNSFIDSYNYLVYWYTHNALVHYLTPHGLEQCNGAAWGTRDVCQGPAEYFLATHNFKEVRRILLNVYQHQFIESGDFPQWFMFDRFYNIQDSGSHGDIIVWPARLLALYLQATNDFSILDEKIPYTYNGKGEFTSEKYLFKDHLIKEITSIEDHFIKGTYLSCYGGGDWDDTLQPAHSEYKEQMASGWTVSLTYEMFNLLGKVINDQNLSNKYLDLAKRIKEDYQKYIIKDEVPMGFIHFDKDEIKCIIHPSDKVTNIQYRLLPFTRGIISEMFSKEQALNACKIIYENLKFPDGVRLMNKTVTYNGGIKHYFNRAETSANFGREIGLQYCHAHIRYCEAMQKMGNAELLYHGLLEINPLVMSKIVRNAMPRQRNSYFSSSDGSFLNRYDAMNNFDKLKTGEIPVKSGWRIYSSGSGIYLSTLITGLLGIKIKGDKVLLDPVLPLELDGLELDYQILNKHVKIKYHTCNANRKLLINNQLIDYQENKNSYRNTGFIFPISVLTKTNEIEVYL